MSFLINQAIDPFLVGDEALKFTKLFMFGLSAFLIAPALFLRCKAHDEPVNKLDGRTARPKLPPGGASRSLPRSASDEHRNYFLSRCKVSHRGNAQDRLKSAKIIQ
jgi:hypothetical protein